MFLFVLLFLSLQVIGSDHDYHFVHHALPHARTKRSVLHTRQLKADPLVSSMRHAIFTRLHSFIQFCLAAAYIYVYIDMDHHSLFCFVNFVSMPSHSNVFLSLHSPNMPPFLLIFFFSPGTFYTFILFFCGNSTHTQKYLSKAFYRSNKLLSLLLLETRKD